MHQRKRDLRRLLLKGNAKLQSIESFESQPLREGLTSIKSNNRWFDFFYEDRGAEVTLVTFTAAMPTKIENYPLFSGESIARNLNVNWLAFSDAACGSAESLPTFWHLGTKRVNSQKFIPAIIQKTNEQGSGKHLLFFGSSAGGFAALNYSSLFSKSAVLALNPRVNLLNHPKHFIKYSEKAFVGVDPQRLARKLPYDMARHYSEPHGNSVFYIQNLQDTNYVRHHYSHFVKATQKRADVSFITGEWGAGHVVPPQDVYVGALAALAASAPDWRL